LDQDHHCLTGQTNEWRSAVFSVLDFPLLVMAYYWGGTIVVDRRDDVCLLLDQ
jgi:hypothetical protein